MHILSQAQLAISWFRLLYLDEPCRNWVVYLLAIMSRSGLDELSAFCARFEETAKTSEYLLDQKDRADKAVNQLSRENNHKNSKIVACFEEISLEGLLYIMAIARKNHVFRTQHFCNPNDLCYSFKQWKKNLLMNPKNI